MVSGLRLFTIREGAQGFIISMRASGRFSARYLEGLEMSCALLAIYSEEQDWPPLPQLTTTHMETYLDYLRNRPRWFGDRDRANPKPMSQSYIESNYRRLKRFWRWLKERGHVEESPWALIPHPAVDEKVIPTMDDQDILNMLALVDPRWALNPSERFRCIRDRAAIMLLVDTPGRRTELATITLDTLDMVRGIVKVFGKGARERWMPIGMATRKALASYLEVREVTGTRSDALWLTTDGRPMLPSWLYKMLRRLGERSGANGVHTHRFRHTFAMAALRSGMPERLLMALAGWKKRVPATYYATLSAEDAVMAHRAMSPADRLSGHPGIGRAGSGQKPKGQL